MCWKLHEYECDIRQGDTIRSRIVCDFQPSLTGLGRRSFTFPALRAGLNPSALRALSGEQQEAHTYAKPVYHSLGRATALSTRVSYTPLASCFSPFPQPVATDKRASKHNAR